MKNNTIIDCLDSQKQSDPNHTAFSTIDSSVENESEIEKKLQHIISRSLPIDYGLLPPNQLLLDFNFTSVQYVEIILDLQHHFNHSFPPTFVHDNPTIEQMKKYILDSCLDK